MAMSNATHIDQHACRSVGGIVASAMRGRIKCDNTLDRSVVYM